MNALARLLPAVLAATALAVAAAPAAAAESRVCRPAGSKTVAQNGQARLYAVSDDQSIVTTTLYGCLFSRGKPLKLADAYDDDFVLSSGYRTPRLAGRFVAFGGFDYDISCKADCPQDYDPGGEWMTVANLTTRRLRSVEIPAEAAGESLRLNSAGAVAWLQRVGGGERQVHVWDADGHRVVDTGPIRGKSRFRLLGSALTWDDAGTARSLTLRGAAR
jgi:hypothetical protein